MKVKEYLIDERTTTFEECLYWARQRFQDLYYNKILQLTYSFPEDSVTSTGNLFWSPPKRFPRPIKFDPFDPTHFKFVAIGAQLRANVFSIQVRILLLVHTKNGFIYHNFWCDRFWLANRFFPIGIRLRYIN